MKEDNHIDQEVQDILDIVAEHGRIARRQQQLSAMIDRSTALKRRHRWLWAVVAVVMLSVAVALSLDSDMNQAESMVQTMDEPNREMPQVVDEPMALIPENEIVTSEEPVVGTQDRVEHKSSPVKPSAFAASVEAEKQQASFDEPFENQNIESVSNETNHTVIKKKTDSVAPIGKRENPYRPKNKFTLRVGGEIDPYDLGYFPHPPITSHFSLGLTLDYHFTEYFSMGLGAEWFGVSTYNCFYSSWQDRLHAIPIFTDLKLNVWGKKNYSPFLEARLGYSIPLNKVTEYFPLNGCGVYVDYILSGPYLSLGLGCSIKHSNLSAGMVYSHASSPGKLKESLDQYYLNLLNWGTNFYIRYDYTF